MTNRSRPSRITTGSRESFERARSAHRRGRVGDGQPGGLQLAPGRVGASAPVLERRCIPAQADRHVALPVTPGAAEAVGDQHGGASRRSARAGARAGAARRRRGRGAAVTSVSGRPPPRRWRRPPPRWRTRSRGGCGRSSTPRSARSDLGGLVEHDLDRARVLALLGRQFARARLGRTSASATTAPSALETALCAIATTCPSRSGSPSSAPRRSALARSSPARTSGRPSSGTGGEAGHSALALRRWS